MIPKLSQMLKAGLAQDYEFLQLHRNFYAWPELKTEQKWINNIKIV